MLQIFKRFHAAFIDAISNPFYTVNTVCFLPMLLMSKIQKLMHTSVHPYIIPVLRKIFQKAKPALLPHIPSNGIWQCPLYICFKGKSFDASGMLVWCLQPITSPSFDASIRTIMTTV